jgi:hypothetical protein
VASIDASPKPAIKALMDASLLCPAFDRPMLIRVNRNFTYPGCGNDRRVCLSWSIFLPLEPPCPLSPRLHQLAEVSVLRDEYTPLAQRALHHLFPEYPWEVSESLTLDHRSALPVSELIGFIANRRCTVFRELGEPAARLTRD